MKRKITDFALVSKCGGLAASGFTLTFASACSRRNIASSASAPNPFAAVRRMLRRVRGRSLRNIDKLVSVEECEAEVLRGATGVEEVASHALLGLHRFAGERE